MSLQRVKLVTLNYVPVGTSLQRLKLVSFIYVPVRRRKNISNRSVSLTYQWWRRDDVLAWSATSQPIWDLNETSLRRRMSGGKLYFNNEGLNWNELLLKEESRLFHDEKELANLMNYFSINVTAELDLKKYTEAFLGTFITLNEAIEKFQYQPSTKRIRETSNNNEKFSFLEVTGDQIRKEILHLNGSKGNPVGHIVANILKLLVDFHLSTITKFKNPSPRCGCFSNDLKSADVSPILEKDNDLEKENHRLRSVLPHTSKIFERIMYTQINNLMKTNCHRYWHAIGKTATLSIAW